MENFYTPDGKYSAWHCIACSHYWGDPVLDAHRLMPAESEERNHQGRLGSLEGQVKSIWLILGGLGGGSGITAGVGKLLGWF